MSDFDYDVAIVGSGFGGSVTALRLREKGYSVVVLEAGRRFADHEFATSSWDVRRYLWAPWARCFGILRLTPLRDVLIASGAGVGGGSLVYANTLYQPGDEYFEDSRWAHITDWRAELEPHFDQARRMLGVVTYPGSTEADRLMAEVAEELGVAETVHPADVGVLFAERPALPLADPFFGGRGPDRTSCTECGACLTGCRVGAKNTLVKNYLYLAEQAGVEVRPLTTVTDVRPLRGGYRVSTRGTGTPWKRGRLTAEQVVFSGNSLNTQDLLHRLRRRSLPRMSPLLGTLARTNSESVLSARDGDRRADHTPGLAITSSFHPDPQTHVEPVRYGPGSGLIGLLNAHLVDPVEGVPRWRATLRTYRRLGVRKAFRLHDPRRWAEQSIVILTMQTLDNSVTTFLRRRPWGLRMTTREGIGEPSPEWIPVSHRVARSLARRVGGVAGGSVADLVGVPVTAHFIGGCVIGATAEEGVVDPYQRLFGHPGLHVVDGSTISANLGVNPALTITAQAERALSFWPNRGEPDARPALGEPYRRLAAVPPRDPQVPAGAGGELRWAR
ncbi:FAD-dependent oxidoreductase [Aeromicrobium choanae]|uniref:Cholesterol oxidase n=1 Tax=Aeromicrobium choanae TaxID=1736691 RepID=A0A1T4Z182_9ACTN|nr:GMC family oxidoreductase [Aeromicrobium choanae]SKB07800.1 cholesterol oxidase [Aeromicrobium choanae]